MLRQRRLLGIYALLVFAMTVAQADRSSANLPRAQATIEQRLGIPAYFYPFPPASCAQECYWAQLDRAAPIVGIAIINPDSGPGSTFDQNYADQAQRSQAAGIAVLGYVYTSYANRASSAVKTDVDLYYAWYHVDGIFFDEAYYQDCVAQSYYQDLNTYVKARGGKALTIINPGTLIPECAITTADIIVNFEDTYALYLTWQPMGWEQKYPADRFWHLLHTTSETDLMAAIALSRQRNVGWVFVTPDTLDNPWDTLPSSSYWDTELRLVLPHRVFVPMIMRT